MFFDGQTHAHADGILRDLESQASDALAPMLWRYEVSAVLARGQARGDIPPDKVGLYLEALKALPITIDDDSAEHIFTDVHQLAVSHRLTTYDAAYLEIAVRRNLPLATLDLELIAAAARTGVQVR